MADQTVTVTDQASGSEIDVSQVTREDGTAVQRQRINISDPERQDAHAGVRGEAGNAALMTTDQAILGELQAIRISLEEFKLLFAVALKK